MSLADLLDANYAENPPAFRDNRLHELFFRYRARHFPETLNAFEQEEWQRWRAKRLEFAPDGGQSLLDFEQMLDRLRSQFQNDADKLQILTELTEWGQRLRKHI
jgi:exodeoxyribonuclease-1